jgi:hypothetical protein
MSGHKRNSPKQTLPSRRDRARRNELVSKPKVSQAASTPTIAATLRVRLRDIQQRWLEGRIKAQSMAGGELPGDRLRRDIYDLANDLLIEIDDPALILFMLNAPTLNPASRRPSIKHRADVLHSRCKN